MTGFYARLTVDTRRVLTVGQAGGVLMSEVIRVSCVGFGLSTALDWSGKPAAGRDPAKIVLNLAGTLPGPALRTAIARTSRQVLLHLANEAPGAKLITDVLRRLRALAVPG